MNQNGETQAGQARFSLRDEAMARANSAKQMQQTNVIPAHAVASPTTGGAHQHQQAVSQPTAEAARKKWREHGEHNSQVLENRRAALRSAASTTNNNNVSSSTIRTTNNAVYSVRVVSAEDRVDPAGSYYTAYLMEVETGPNHARHMVEHRYSEFARLHSELSANKVNLRSSFPNKSICGRLGNWTPAQHWAPDKMAELVTYRKIKLDIWLVELAELVARGEHVPGGITGDMRELVLEFFQKSAAGCPPCDRANPVCWDGLDGSTGREGTGNGDAHMASSQNSSVSPSRKLTNSVRHAGGAEKLISNPVSFTLGSEIRKATYTVEHMCGAGALAADRSIPLDLLHQAKGLCFLTVIKIGCVVSGRVGTGLIIARTKDGGWSPPSAIGTVGLGYGALIGGDITSYLIVLNTERAVATFASRGSVNLGAELGVAVGPVGRGATGNLNAGEGGIAPAYSYAHSKGLFVGISLEGSVVASRPDVNAKFYGRPVDANMLLFESSQWRPRAAQPLYDALDEALDAQIVGFRPSQIGKSGVSAHVTGPYEGGKPQFLAGYGQVGSGSEGGPSLLAPGETIVDGSTVGDSDI